ncbi:hypothetical protein RN22_12745 [Grimontia sp. AD028]|uniref:hypothetical protein n=1 Tax=Grimontia sp. AD028 TaxID=1581149 RepID=UPI00061B08B7|nr:hypothetical protein [Grimontia sp. AD028]KKD60182.1 hypothetical protein RN22_12745 [Grimontia sp. AD028]
MLARNAVLLSMLGTLAACGGGGGSSSTDGGTPSTQTTTYTVIDGYLGDAEVYVDRNANLIAESFELLGTTNTNGEIEVDKRDEAYDLIVKIIAGKTTDSDIEGTVAFNKEYISAPDSPVITPTSTLAKLNNMSLEALSSALNISADDISGDFVANQKHHAHVLNRSLNLLLSETLGASNTKLTEILEDSRKLADYINAQAPNADLSDLTLVINESGGIEHSTPDKVHRTRFDLAGMTLQWEQKDFSSVDYTDPSEQGFHPCYLAEFAGNLLLVSNCSRDKYITLDTETGEIVSVSPTLQNNDIAYIDGEHVALVAFDGNITYLDKTLQPAIPSDEVLTRENDILIAGIGRWALVDKTDGGTYRRLRRDAPSAFLNNNHYYEAELLTYRAVGEVTSIYADGNYTVLQDVMLGPIRDAVIEKHNASSLGFIADNENTKVEWLAPNVYLSRVDTDGEDNGYVSNDYHYLYFSDGRLEYLGQMDQGTWWRGADDSSIVYYDVSKVDGEGHMFKQFSLKNGEQLAQWERTADELSANLYGQLHTKAGIYSNSDSYSTVIKFK